MVRRSTLCILCLTMLSLIAASAVLTSITVPSALAAAPKPLSKLVYYAYSDDNKGLFALAKGDIDIYVPSKPVTEDMLRAAGINPASVRIAYASGGIAVMLFNILSDDNELGKLGIVTDPSGKKHFNPLALREIRYALNLLINRKYIAEKIVGAAYPAFVALSPSLPYYSEIEKAIEEMGFKPEGDLEKAKKIIDETLTKVAQQLKKYGYELYKKSDGFWYFKAPGQPEERVTIIIDTWWEKYTYHCGAMRYFAQQLKKVGFDAKVICGNARKYRDSRDWRYMHWHIYTYRRVISEDLLPIWFIDGMYWTYSSAALPRQIREHLEKMGDKLQKEIDEAIAKLRYAKTMSQLIEEVKKVVKLVMEQSIVVAYVNPLRTIVISNRVHDAVIGWASSIYNPWLYRTAWTSTGVLRVGIFSSQMDITTPINPTLAMHTLSRARILMPVVDIGTFPNPYIGKLVPLRASWSVTPAKVPANALYFDPSTHSWITVKEAEAKGLLNASKISKEHTVRIVYNYILGKWQHGRNMTLADILMWFAWGLDWMYKSGKDDKWYFEDIDEHPMRWTSRSLTCVYGIEIINRTSLAIYTSTDCVGTPNPDLLAEMFIGMINTWGPRGLWPWFPPELMMAIGYLKIYGGPVSGKSYVLVGHATEKVARLDLTDPKQVEDLKAALEKIAKGEYMPPFIEATLKLADKYPVIGKPDLREGAKKLIEFANKYGHLVVSQGPYIIAEYKPDRIVFTRFEGYPRSLESFYKELTSVRIELKSISTTNVVVQAGKATQVTLTLCAVTVFPEEVSGAKPAEKAYVVARILKAGEEVAIVKAEKVAPGKFVIKLSPELTKKLGPGTYVMEILYSTSPEAPPSKISATLTILPAASTTTPARTVTATASTTSTVTATITKTATASTSITVTKTVTLTKSVTTTSTVTSTRTVTKTNWGLSVALLIVGIVVGLAVGIALGRRR